MIKTVVKRDGRVEEFNPDKINRWGIWSAKTLGNYVDWPSVVLQTVASLPEECTSESLQEQLIKTCLDNNSWSYNRMAGRLYAALTYKQLYGNEIPTVKELHNRLQQIGFMSTLDYSEEEYDGIEKIINHKQDFKASYYELQHIRKKYSLQNRVTGEEYESQQFVYMRMAMALAEKEPREKRLVDVKNWYEHFSQKRINAPTPNYVNLGTPLRGYASCMVYTTEDTAKSLAVGDHIAYIMTCMSAGVGSHINTRSIGEPVRSGLIAHQGRLPYYRALDGAVHANLQSGRGGAVTVHYQAFDPEAEVISQLKNPMSTEDKRIRGLDYSFGSNKLFARKAAKNEDVFAFNSFNAPDLWDAFYSGDSDLFEKVYSKYENDKSFTKKWINARDLLVTVLNEAYETGRAYLHFPEEMNRHTPFKDTIYSSNLCQEIALPTKGYPDMPSLYSEEDHGKAEIGLCSLAAICVDHIKDDDEYADAMYYALKMIDKCIDLADYALPHLEVTAKARRSAGVGIVGLAHYMAQKHLTYSSQEGKEEIHRVAEKHIYFAIRASLRLSKELGVAKWMHKTKWPEGWLPLDTYNRNVDSVVDIALQYDWESLRSEIIQNGGIRNSVLVAYMPSESSSIASGTTNSVYPVRSLTLIKGDANKVTYWAAPDGEKLSKWYDIAWNVSPIDLIHCYAIIQKWTDQGISADLYDDVSSKKISASEMMKDYFAMIKYGLKSRYYMNTLTTKGMSLDGDALDIQAEEEYCESCTL